MGQFDPSQIIRVNRQTPFNRPNQYLLYAPVAINVRNELITILVFLFV